MKRFFIFSLLLFVVRASQSEVLDKMLAYFANPEIDVMSYHFNVTVTNLDAQSIPIQTEIKLIPNKDTSSIELHMESQFLKIKSARVNGRAAQFSLLKGIPNHWDLSGDVLEIRGENLEAGKSTTLNIDYDLTLNKKMAGLFKSGSKLLTLGWPYYARFWFPANDSPLDAATVSFILNVPSELTAIANGKLVNVREVGKQKSYYWTQAKPTTTYNFIFSVGVFETYREDICFNFDGKINDQRADCKTAKHKIPLEIYLEPGRSDAKAVIESVRSSSNSLIYFSKLFGEYEFEKLGFIVSSYPFSMESTSLIVLTGAGAAVHEVAHHWWGNNVRIPHWGDFWISEGFTTYVTGLYDEYRFGKNTSCLDDKSADKLNNPATTDPKDIFNQIPYCKGAASLHAVRLTLEALTKDKNLATQAFLNLLAKLYQTYKGKVLSTEDFVKFVRENAVTIYSESGVPIDPQSTGDIIEAWLRHWYGI